jgi:hypothetical protein
VRSTACGRVTAPTAHNRAGDISSLRLSWERPQVVSGLKFHHQTSCSNEPAAHRRRACRKPPYHKRIPANRAVRGGLATYCFSAGGFASGVGAGASGSGVGVAPRSSGAATQSPAHSFVPLTVPTSLQPIAARGFTCFSGLPPTLGAPV